MKQLKSKELESRTRPTIVKAEDKKSVENLAANLRLLAQSFNSDLQEEKLAS